MLSILKFFSKIKYFKLFEKITVEVNGDVRKIFSFKEVKNFDFRIDFWKIVKVVTHLNYINKIRKIINKKTYKGIKLILKKVDLMNNQVDVHNLVVIHVPLLDNVERQKEVVYLWIGIIFGWIYKVERGLLYFERV